jgi:hypothetical protein
MNDTMQRQSKFQKLVNERREKHPNEDYNTAFNAVMTAEGQQLVAEMHIANEDAVPTFNPRSARLVGLSYPADEAIFRETWLRKQGPLSGGGPGPKYPSPEDEKRAVEKTNPIDEVATKEEGKAGFLSEVNRLIKQGHEYSAAWAIAGSTSPGKESYSQWSRGSAQLKGSGGSIAIDNSAFRLRQHEFAKLMRSREEAFPGEGYSARFQFVCNSAEGKTLLDEMTGDPADDKKVIEAAKKAVSDLEPSERHNPAILAEAKKAFDDLVARLKLEDQWLGKSDMAVRGFAMSDHPAGKKLYDLIQRQDLLKKKQELAARQKGSY